jgi:SAM-dependent methyltransferase
MTTSQEMIEVNRQQAVFYDRIQAAEEQANHAGYSHNEDANALTRLWAALRYQQQRAIESTGIRARVQQTHTRWLSEKSGGNFLEIGCFSGSDYTFDLIDAAGTYTGIELSSAASTALRRKIDARGLSSKAAVICGDFLEYEPNRKFDLIYAHGVLHHFENPEPLFTRIRHLVADDGVLVFVEPVAINPVYRVLRAAYRPFQSDAAWEWPFRKQTVASLTQRFAIVDGFGWGRFSLPLSVLCGIPGLAPAYRWVARNELVDAQQRAYWQSSMVMAKCQPR